MNNRNIKKNYKTNKVSILLLIAISISFFSGKLYSNNEILNAMRDEIKRSMNELKLDALQKPYYIEYKLTSRNPKVVKASLGCLIDTNDLMSNQLVVGLRVGNYKFDNTNYLDFGFSFFGSGDDEENFKNRRIPLELDYNTIRRELWLATDAAYKQSAELYSKKEAAIKNRVRTDTTHDFIQLSPEKNYIEREFPDFDKNKYQDIMKRISAIFLNYPEIHISNALIEFMPSTNYYVNSEGREFIKTHYYYDIEIVAATQSEDGMQITDYYSAFSNNPKDLPSEDSLNKAVHSLIDRILKIRKAKVLDEPYSGPIMFDGQAANQLFAQFFAPNLVTQRMPLTEQSTQENERSGAFQTKIGGRVLPEFLSINAIPDKDYYGSFPLIGNCRIDDEGVKTQNVALVVDGYLKNLLSSRVPTRRVRTTNGHKIGGGPMLSNIELTSKKSNSHKQMVDRMIKLCKDRELPFGIIIKRLPDQNITYTTLMRMTSSYFSIIGRNNNTIGLTEAYKIYPDGREELIRGAEAAGFTVQSFKDIIMVGQNQIVMNYLAPSIASPYINGGDSYLTSSVINPSLLFEDGEIRPIDGDFPKPPILNNPLTISK